MKIFIPFLLVIVLFLAVLNSCSGEIETKTETNIEIEVTEDKMINIPFLNITGDTTSLADFSGKALLLVNVASKCGMTPQYKDLQELYTKYKAKGLVVLGFPANNFENQEPGSNAEIKEFCSTTYGVDFPMFAKISVKGDDIHPLYKWLTSKESNPDFSGDIRWNFDKFLADSNGKIIGRFHPKTKPSSDEVIKAVESALK